MAKQSAEQLYPSSAAFDHQERDAPDVDLPDDLIPDKGQFRLAFSPSAELLLSGNNFSGYLAGSEAVKGQSPHDGCGS